MNGLLEMVFSLMTDLTKDYTNSEIDGGLEVAQDFVKKLESMQSEGRSKEGEVAAKIVSGVCSYAINESAHSTRYMEKR